MKKSSLNLILSLVALFLALLAFSISAFSQPARSIKNNLIIVDTSLYVYNSKACVVDTNNIYVHTNKACTVKNKYEKVFYRTKLSGLVEIDGHIFNNDTMKINPIYYEATMSKISIYDNHYHYELRQCKKNYCEITHLTIKDEEDIKFPQFNIQSRQRPFFIIDDTLKYTPYDFEK
jgi:hypothetical protein